MQDLESLEKVFDLETFSKVFYFFIHDAIDVNYVNTIDGRQCGGLASLPVAIQNFHEMRQNLCRIILEHTGFAQTLKSFVDARGIVQYNQVPPMSECVFSKKKLQPQEGILIVIDNQFPVTFDKRFKTIVFYFWYIVHLPEELITTPLKWMKGNSWWQNGQVTYEEAVHKLQHYNDNIFAKQAYVKLKTVANYIQTEMANIRINSTSK